MTTQASARQRLDPSVFRLPVERIRDGYYSDAYFVYTKRVLEEEGHHPRVTMQVFQKKQSLLGGIDEAIAVLKLCTGHQDPNGDWVPGWDQLEVQALKEGDRISPRESVLMIEGDYSLFAHLETVYLGCLARRSLVMRNVAEVVEAAGGKQIFYFPARHDHWLVQTGDGWSAHVAGAIGVSTDAQASWWGGRGIGTVPHGLIAAYGGDTVRAAKVFADRFHGEMSITVLVDFDNDSLRTAVEVAEALGPQLWGSDWTRARSWSTAHCGTSWEASAPPGSTRVWSRRCGTGSTAPAMSAYGSWPAGASTLSGSGSSKLEAFRWTPTASARRCFAATTTSRQTW
jgi:nicotinate phosphoribosyltransferase